MADNETRSREAKYPLANGPSDETTNLPKSESKHNLLRADQNNKVLNKSGIAEQENEETKQEIQIVETNNNFTIEQDKVKKQKLEKDDDVKFDLIAKNLIKMRLQILAEEMTVIKTYFHKELIDVDKDTLNNIETYLNHSNTRPDINDIKDHEKSLLDAENLSTALMKKIKKVIKVNTTKKELKVQDNIVVPNYRSIVTVRGTKEDVSNCIIKAKAAMDNRKFDRAESLLLKAERMCPTKNARELLKLVQPAIEPKLNPIEKATKALEQNNINKQNILIADSDCINATKCLAVFEKAFTTGDLVKSERILNKARRFDPSLDVEEKLAVVNAAKKIIEEKRKEKQMQEERDWKETGAQPYINLARAAMRIDRLKSALQYSEWAFEKQPNNETRELLEDVQIQIDFTARKESLSKADFEFQANRLLDKANNYINICDLKNAETYLIISWNMNTSRYTKLIHKKYLEARLDLFKRNELRSSEEIDNELNNMLKCDRLVLSALDENENNKFEAQKLLIRAFDLYPSIRIAYLL